MNGTDDQRFINLMRQSHILPFVPLPNTGDASADGALFAVLQPVDAVSYATLQSFKAAHAKRAVWREEPPTAAEQDSAESSEDGGDLKPRDPRLAQATPARSSSEVQHWLHQIVGVALQR